MADLGIRLAARLKNLMNSKGISQLELARRTGLTGATVNALCNGRGTVVVASIVTIASELAVSLDDLLAPEAEITPDALAEAAALRALRVFRDEQAHSAPTDIAPKFPELSDPADQIAAAQIREQLLQLSTRPRLLAQAALFLEAIIEANQDLLAAAEANNKKRG